MKVIFTIPNDPKKYSYPTAPEDVTFGQFVAYLDNVYPKAPEILKQIEETIDAGDQEKVQKLNAGIDNRMLARDIYPYFARVVSHFTGIELSILIGERGPGMNVKTLEALYNTVLRALAPPPSDQYEYRKEVEFNGELWIIPDRLMENASVIEFAEAAQFQAAMSEVKEGHFRALIDVCAVLLRKRGEQYTDNIYKRNKRLFDSLPMDIVWQVAFFLTRRSAALGRDFQIYTASRTLGRLKQELKTLRGSTVGI